MSFETEIPDVPYLYEFVANESSFGIYTRKTKEILFEI
jgi:hypothetical protein